ncbi:uncharacterized protein LOC129237088 [Anastrepha obliqua]|uniref:uncharacterized protein LOC129237088 n=1 Tax=Anastrepha obliqua TaxID=95512 RepID=UPI00240996BC|nr:uncharacterized protein LOC129237088 [Anastrepha obliqua]
MSSQYINDIAKNYCYQVEYVCSPHATCPPARQATTKKPSYSLFVFVIVTFTVFAQMPERSSAASLAHRTHTKSESLESVEDTLNLLHELTRFMHDKHKVGAENETGDDHGYLGQVRRLYKRHNGVNKALTRSDDEPEWQNVCGMDSAWSGDEIAEDLSHDYIQLYMKGLRIAVRLEYNTLKTSGFHEIDIDDMRAWRRHERKYKFLPTLEHNAGIAPVCWHQSMQKFIASFAYLYKIQQEWDQKYLHTQSGIARELHALLQSSKRMLCEMETSIKGSYPRDKQQLNTITRDEMLATINFYTKNSSSAAAGQRGVNHTDLRFAKFFYQNYLLRIWKSLSRHANNIQLQYTCAKVATPSSILDKSLENEASIMSSEVEDDAEE